ERRLAAWGCRECRKAAPQSQPRPKLVVPRIADAKSIAARAKSLLPPGGRPPQPGLRRDRKSTASRPRTFGGSKADERVTLNDTESAASGPPWFRLQAHFPFADHVIEPRDLGRQHSSAQH